ncbi:hypothetical protein HMPREF1554_02149 [Porphyromonas gingivalis F0569]|nr:hypothetical protein HMPREF1554_02149 [Porphyromonas gingivalis F0569]
MAIFTVRNPYFLGFVDSSVTGKSPLISFFNRSFCYFLYRFRLTDKK